jgi:hypothetical protein
MLNFLHFIIIKTGQLFFKQIGPFPGIFRTSGNSAQKSAMQTHGGSKGQTRAADY